MFEQVVGDGANIFITIVAVLIGFVAALSYVDFVKVKKEEDERSIYVGGHVIFIAKGKLF